MRMELPQLRPANPEAKIRFQKYQRPLPPGARVYFYQIDGLGRLFIQDSELTDIPFLKFFFDRLAPNFTGQYPDYGWLSLCQGEYNFVRCEREPFVFHRLEAGPEENLLITNGGQEVKFLPAALLWEQATDTLLYRFTPPEEWQASGPENPGNGKREMTGTFGRNLLFELSSWLRPAGKTADGPWELEWGGKITQITTI